MGERAEEFLYLMLWAADLIGRPAFRTWTGSFETWASRNGYLDEVHSLKRRRFLKSQSRPIPSQPPQVTVEGRLRVLGGREPEACWSRPWDGRWRLVAFDLPRARDSDRKQLRRFLRAHGFGCFQKSVWLRPDPIEALLPELRGFEDDVCRLTTLETVSLGSTSASAIVAKCWDFELIQLGYRRCLDLLRQPPRGCGSGGGRDRARNWVRSEQAAWLEAVSLDPLLPFALQPPGYLGLSTWKARTRVLRRVIPQILASQRAGVFLASPGPRVESVEP
jgi:hypothetical protein